MTVDTRIVNPWQWQEQFGFAQAVEVTRASRILFCTGQGPADEAGQPLHAGDLPAQFRKALDNLQTVLAGADMSLSNVVRLAVYVTDVDAMLQIWEEFRQELRQQNAEPAMMLLGVTRLAFPEMMIDLEATAVA